MKMERGALNLSGRWPLLFNWSQEGVVYPHHFSLLLSSHYLAPRARADVGKLQLSRVTKNPAFWWGDQKREPQENGKYWGDYGERGGWPSKVNLLSCVWTEFLPHWACVFLIPKSIPKTLRTELINHHLGSIQPIGWDPCRRNHRELQGVWKWDWNWKHSPQKGEENLHPDPTGLIAW